MRLLWRLFCLIFVIGFGVLFAATFFSSCRSLDEYEVLPYVEHAVYEGDDGFDVTETRVGGQFAPRPEVTGQHSFRDHRAEATIERLTAHLAEAGYDPETGMHVDGESDLWTKLGAGGGGAASAVATMLLLMRYGLIGGGNTKPEAEA